MKKNIYIVFSVFAIVISLIGGFALGYYFNSNKNDSISDNGAVEDKVLSLTSDELNQKINVLNEPLDYYDIVLLFQNFEANAFDDDGNIRLNVDLFNDVETRIKIAILLDNLQYEERNPYQEMMDYDILKKSYEKIWGQQLELVADQDNKVTVFDVPTGVALSRINVKAKDVISLAKNQYVLKTYVGLAVYLDDGTIVYNYDNDYEGQLLFSKTNDGYKNLSFIIVEK